MTGVAPRVLIAGVGNIFLGDDAFGVEAVARLARRPLPPNVRVCDFGIRALDLVYALAEGVDVLILVDAAPRGAIAGTLHVIEADWPPPDAAPVALEGHSMDPVKVLALAASMGAQLRRVLVVGCEPSPLRADEMQIGLSPAVEAAVDEAVALIQTLVREIAPEATSCTPGTMEATG